MGSSNDELLLNFFRELTKYTRRKDVLIGIVCGIKDEDIEEFTEFIKNPKENERNEHILLEKFVDFSDKKNYKSDDM